MVRHVRLSFAGYQGHPVPHRFLTQDEDTLHLAVILPGFGYHCDMPLLYFTAAQLVTDGADVLLVDYAYDSNPEYLAANAATREVWLQADVTAAYNAAAAKRPYERITVVAKSLGTRALAHLLASSPAARPWAVWYTPILSDANVARELQRSGSPSLVVVGTADPYYDAVALRAAGQSPGVTVLAIEAADHSLELPGDVVKSARVLADVLQSLRHFLRSG